MNVTTKCGEVRITLSRRNLLQLLDEMARTGRSASLIRMCDGTHLHVTVEQDDVHYKNRTPGPGLSW